MEKYWERTIEAYRNVLAAPEIAEKYLRRPPFKYIFQIFLALQAKTSFAEGLLAREETSADFYSTPERKLTFLKKLAQVVYKTLGRPCTLKPKSVVKGEECDKTNEFLCDLLAAAISAGKDGGRAAPLPDAVAPKAEEVRVKPSVVREAPPRSGEAHVERKKETPRGALQLPSREELKSTTVLRKEENALPVETGLNEKRATNASNEKATSASKAKPAEANEERAREPSGGRSITMGTIAGSGQYWTERGATALSSEDMRVFVQKVTQNTNPLGKLIDYAEDDLENMAREHKNWLRVHHEATAKLEKLEAEQDGELEGLNAKAQHLDEQALELEEKIAGLRGKIVKTEQRIAHALQRQFA